jgi:hypothetical protein
LKTRRNIRAITPMRANIVGPLLSAGVDPSKSATGNGWPLTLDGSGGNSQREGAGSGPHLGVPVGLTAKIRNVALRLLQCVYFGVCVMNDVVERILNTYQSMCPLDAERAADSRQRISRYIESLASAGQRDDEQLTIYGLAYLTELHEGPDPRFTGC